MKIVSQKISTHIPPMPIIHCKERTFRPWREMRLVGRTRHVQNDRDSILIVVPNNALVGVCSICPHNSVSFKRAFRRLEVWPLEFLRVGHVRPEKINCLSFWVSCWLSFDLPQLGLHILFLRILLLGRKRKGKLLDDAFLRFVNVIKIHLHIVVKVLELVMQLVSIKFCNALLSLCVFIPFLAGRSLCFFAWGWVNRLSSMTCVNLHGWWRRVKFLLF